MTNPVNERSRSLAIRDAIAAPDEYPLVISAWIHLVLGPFALAPLYGGLFNEDPLSPAMLERQTRFLRKLARLIANARPDETRDAD